MKNEMQDFSSLDPRRRPDDWERRIRRITAAAAAPLARRRNVVTLPRQLAYWAGPVLATAAGIAVMASGLLLYPLQQPVASATPSKAQTIKQSPTVTVVTWAVNNHVPNPAEMLEINWRWKK